MMDKRNLLKLMVLALGVSVLLFVFGYPRGAQPIDEHTIRYVIEQEPSTLIPQSLLPLRRLRFNFNYLMVLFVLMMKVNQKQHLQKNGKSLMMVASIPSIYDLI